MQEGITHTPKELLTLGDPVEIVSAKALREITSPQDQRENVALTALRTAVAEPQQKDLGLPVVRTDIISHVPEFHVLQDSAIEYPQPVKDALCQLYSEYNRQFTTLADQNREWPTDYQYCTTGPNGSAVNYFVQIDMVGLPDAFLAESANLPAEQVAEALRGNIFEIENSLAMYQLLERLFEDEAGESQFNTQFRRSLQDLRETHGKPIALLAVTDEKHEAMRESEFGKTPGEPLTDEEVIALSGFDRFFGPEEFQQYLEQTDGECEYLLYVRSSEPVSKLRKPTTKVSAPLLENDESRRVIKAHTITFNIDRPGMAVDDSRRINDTKAYLEPMGMGVNVYNPDTVNDFMNSERFAEYLLSEGVAQEQIDNGAAEIVAKPMYASYGAYGHHKAEFGNKKLHSDLRRGIRKRGPYVIQPRYPTPLVHNTDEGQTYAVIHRNFLSTTDGQNFQFMGGFQSFMPVDTQEYQRGRNHGNVHTRWGEIK